MYERKYMGGRPDALLTGRNVELTNNLTLQRRPGLSTLNTGGGAGAFYPTAPDRAFSFQLSTGSIQLIIDTTSSGVLAVTSANNASAGTTVYNGTFPGGASNGYLGLTFIITGFSVNPGNNGTYVVTASTLTTLTLSNVAGVAETIAATAVTAGGIYLDNQDGTKLLLVSKSVGAGQAYFIAVAGVLYIGDGVDTKKYTPLNPNGTIWKWGIDTPLAQPTITITASGAASTVWQANTVFSTMGLTKDTNATPQIWQLIGVNADGTNTPGAQFGTAGNGEPLWPTAEGATVVDNGVTWTNAGVLNDWAKNTFFTDLGNFGNGSSFAQPGAIAVSNVEAIYGNYKNSGGLGNTGSTEPAFSGAYPGPNYFDNNTHWFAIGKYSTTAGMQAMRWKQSHAYSTWHTTGSNASIAGTPNFILTGNLPAATGTPVYIFVPTTGGTSGSGYQPFPANAGIGAVQGDGQLQWLNLGQAAWQANHPYSQWVSQGLTFGCVYDGANFQVCIATGVSGAHQPGTALNTSTSVSASNASGGNTTYTLGSGSWSFTPSTGDQVAFSGFTNAGNNGTFRVISATSNTIVVANAAGISETATVTTTANPWATAYGSTTQDGSVRWTCVGQNVAWAAGSATTGIWNLPTVGFQPPGPSEAFGGSSVNGANGFVQAVIESGKSGSGSAPAFVTPTTVPPTTTDGTITWQAIGAVTTQSISWSFGLAYAYSYKARPINDFYSPLPLGGGAIPPGSVFLGAPFGSMTNAISTASPVNQIVGANSGAVNTISGEYSADPQVDTIVIWRSADSASGAGDMFELTEIPNVPALAGVSQWHFQDFLPSVATGSFPGLNVLIAAPIDDSNDPPPSTFLPMVYNYNRIWGANGESVSFSGGPDVFTGNKNEAFNPSDEIPFLAPVTRLIRSSQGIVTFLTDSIEMIQGGPATATFFSVTLAPGIGLSSYNMCDVYAGEILFFSSDNIFYVITPSLNVSNFGFPLGDQFANQPVFGSLDTTWNPATGYVAIHQKGTDNAVFVADGSTGWYRLNPHQVPGGMQGPEPIWSPFAAITNGCKMVQSVETSPGIRQLLVGPNGPGQIFVRNQTVYTDNGTQYDANFTMGSIRMAKSGQLALLKHLEFDFSGVNYKPTVSYLLNEISGAFTPFVNGINNTPQFDPPSLYGETIIPSSYSPNRYYFSANASLARCVHMQIKVDFGTTSNADEVYSLVVFGRLVIEN
jgi:hypothetical protein